MTSTRRGTNAATFVAVVATIVLALIWLRSSDDGAPPVPAGLSVATLPAPASRDEAAAPVRGVEGERAGGGDAPERGTKRRRPERKAKGEHADRAGGREDARARVGDPGARTGGRDGISQDPPATAPAPSAGSGTDGSRATTPRPEFALE